MTEFIVARKFSAKTKEKAWGWTTTFCVFHEEQISEHCESESFFTR